MLTETNATVNTGEQAEKLYDLCMIDKMCRGNQEQVKKMVTVFINQAMQSVEEIKQACHNKDFKLLKSVAHRFKPTLSYYAIVKLDKDIKRIEALAKEGQETSEMESKIERLETVLAQVIAQMKKDMLN